MHFKNASELYILCMMVNFMYVNITSTKKKKKLIIMGLLNIWLASPTQVSSTSDIELP